MLSWTRLDSEYDDAISRIRFAPSSKNLLISSWDSKLRLYDVGSSEFRLETPAKAAQLDCCFQNDLVALSTGSNGFIRSHDLDFRNIKAIGKPDDIANRIEFSVETGSDMMVTMGADIYQYDLRNLETPQRKDYRGFGRSIACGTLVPRGFAVGTVDDILTLEIVLSLDPDPIKSIFHCHPMSNDPRFYQAALNDIVFSYVMFGTIITSDKEGHVIA